MSKPQKKQSWLSRAFARAKPIAPDQRHRILISRYPDAETISIRGLTIIRPDEEIKTIEDSEVMIGGINLEFKPGDRVVITGGNGSGKTTLLRSINGDFPFGEGRIILPGSKKMITMPQLPYIHDSNFRAALSYPAVNGDAYTDEQLKGVLHSTNHDRLMKYLIEDGAKAIEASVENNLPAILQTYSKRLEGLNEQELQTFSEHMREQIDDSFVPAISLSHAQKISDRIISAVRNMQPEEAPSQSIQRMMVRRTAHLIAKDLYEKAWPELEDQQEKTVTGSSLQRTLSGGEKQRFRFATILLQKPDILLMDEPTANLDEKAGLEMYKLIMDVMPKESIIISVAHKPELLKFHNIHIHVENNRITVRRLAPEAENQPIMGMDAQPL